LFDKKITVNCTSVLLILLFTSQHIFQRKVKSEFLVGFIVFFKWTFLKNMGVFLGRFFLYHPCTAHNLIRSQVVILSTAQKATSECYVIERFIGAIAQRSDYFGLLHTT